jgi:hypothetical protein
MELPTDIDSTLWFTTERGGERYYLHTYGAHTSFGRMYAYDPRQRESFCVSKNEIVEASRESQYFIAGFLTGNEPTRPVGASGPLPESDPRVVEWRRHVAEFHASGVWKGHAV